jgi:hypothetical protein
MFFVADRKNRYNSHGLRDFVNTLYLPTRSSQDASGLSRGGLRFFVSTMG